MPQKKVDLFLGLIYHRQFYEFGFFPNFYCCGYLLLLSPSPFTYFICFRLFFFYVLILRTLFFSLNLLQMHIFVSIDQTLHCINKVCMFVSEALKKKVYTQILSYTYMNANIKAYKDIYNTQISVYGELT